MRSILPLAIAVTFAVTPALAEPKMLTLNKDHTDVVFEIDHAGFSMKHGWFREMSGTLSFDEKHWESSTVDVTIKTGSIDTNHQERDKDLSGPKFLDAVNFPNMHFVSTKVTRTGDHTLDIEGNLTLHGVTRPLVLHAVLNKAAPNPFSHAPTLGFTANAALKRSDFGVAAGIPLIGDTVSMKIDAEFDEPKT